MILYFALAAVLIALDQIVKTWALHALQPAGSIQFLPGFLKWTYVENRGAAFGIFAGQRWVLSAISLAVVCVCVWCLWTRKFKTKAENVCIALITAGGAGNLIDRITRGFVVDYIDVNELFSYPMFNLADCCVVVGAILFALLAFVTESREKKSVVEKGTAQQETAEQDGGEESK